MKGNRTGGTAMPKLDRAAWLFSVNCFAAALLALLIGFWLDLPRPYWAVMTVYIISQPLAGAVRSKALFRVAGTLLGAAFAVLVVPPLVDMPALLSLVLAAWVAGCLFISLLDRSPRAYVVMLAGYTATLIAFPTVGHPEQVFDIAVSRVEEIILGIFCATLTHSLLFPRPVGSVLQQRLSAWMKDADAWALDILRRADPEQARGDRRNLAVAANEIQLLSRLLPFDTSALRDTAAVVRAIHERLLLLIPILSGVADRLAALSSETAPLDPLLTDIGGWIEAGAPADTDGALAARLIAEKTAQIGRDWPALLRESLIARLQDMLTNLGEAHQLLAHLRQPGVALPPALAAAIARQGHRPLHRDVGIAASSGLSAGLTILLVCAVWIVTGWPEGAIAAALAGVFCALFATLDDPAPAIIGFGLFSGLAIPVAALYQFAILPAIDGFPLLAMVLAPPFLLAGAFMPDRQSALPALAFVIGLASALALQENFSIDFAAFLNSNSAQYVALFVALLVTRTLRSLSVDRAAQRLLRRSWQSMAKLAQGGQTTDLRDFTAEMVDRLGLLTPKLAAAGAAGTATGVDALTDLRVGMNLAMLHGERAQLAPAQTQTIEKLLKDIGGYFAARGAGGPAQPDRALLVDLDHGLAQLAAEGEKGVRPGVTALVGLRRNLFAGAAPFQPPLGPAS